MSFGFSVGDFILLAILAYQTVQYAKNACGAHDSLTREVSSLHVVLRRLEIEVSKPDSLLNPKDDHRRRELATLATDCKRILKTLSQILEKYIELPKEKKSATKLWQRVKFGNGEMQDLATIRSEVATYTQVLTLFWNLLSIGTLGKIEVYMDSYGDDLKDMRHAIHWVTSSMQAQSHGEKSILTSCTEDDKGIWKSFRREFDQRGLLEPIIGKTQKDYQATCHRVGRAGGLGRDHSVRTRLNREFYAAQSRPPRLAVRLSSIAAVEDLPGPIFEKVPLYPFVSPHESKGYGSPHPMEMFYSSDSASENDLVKQHSSDIFNTMRRKSPQKRHFDG